METIGDAYMVVGGVPDPDPAHAQQVGRLALGMQTESAQVISPLTRQSIQVRVDRVVMALDPESKGRHQNSHIQTTYKPQKVLCVVTYFSPTHHM